MERLKSLKAASIILLVHGAVEVVGVVLAPYAPAEFLPQSLQGTWAFTSLLSLVYGVSRLVAAAAVWGLKKWGTAFGAALCVSTLAAAPSIYPYGVMDSLLAAAALALLLHAWFGEERLR